MLSSSPTVQTGTLAAANNLSDLANAATARTNLGVHSKAEIAALRNALAPRGGVAFDGTASSMVRATLTGQVVATDPFSIVIVARVPSAITSGDCAFWVLGPSATTASTTNNIGLWCEASTGHLRAFWRDTSGATNNASAYVNNFVTNYAGKIVMITLVRNASGVWTLYINAAAQAFTSTTLAGTGSYQGQIDSTYLLLGANSATVQAGQIYSATLYNLALSAADVTEIYELGGAVPEKYKFGSQTSLTTNGGFETAGGGGADLFADWTENLGGASTINRDTTDYYEGTASARIDMDGSASNSYLSTLTGLTAGKVHRISFAAKCSVNGGTTTMRAGGNVLSNHTLTTAWALYSVEVTPTVSGTMDIVRGDSTQASRSFWFDSFTIRRVGAVVHLPLNDGIGYQLHDESTNKLDAVMTTTGVSHILAQRFGYVRGTLTWAATHEAKSLIGQRALPNQAVIERITRKATAGSSGSGCTIGTTNSATRWQALDTFTTAKELATLANTLPAGTADADCDIVVDPDTANFTGSIEVEVAYAQTEGTA